MLPVSAVCHQCWCAHPDCAIDRVRRFKPNGVIAGSNPTLACLGLWVWRAAGHCQRVFVYCAADALGRGVLHPRLPRPGGAELRCCAPRFHGAGLLTLLCYLRVCFCHYLSPRHARGPPGGGTQELDRTGLVCTLGWACMYTCSVLLMCSLTVRKALRWGNPRSSQKWAWTYVMYVSLPG